MPYYDRRKNVLDQPLKNNLRTYDNIIKSATDQGNNYTTGCLLHYISFKIYYKSILIDFSKQQNLDADSKEIQQINFTGNLHGDGNTKMLFIIKEAKEIILDFSQGTVRIL